MNTIYITVTQKIATSSARKKIVCGNSDYQIKFTFDNEWSAYSKKTARLIWNGKYYDIEFTGDTCSIPVLTDTEVLRVGVYAGDLRTTTPATILCQKSILCGGEEPNPGTGQNYTNEAKAAAEEAKAVANEIKAMVEETQAAIDKAQELENLYGDFSEVLDSIIAIQESLVQNGKPEAPDEPDTPVTPDPAVYTISGKYKFETNSKYDETNPVVISSDIYHGKAVPIYEVVNFTCGGKEFKSITCYPNALYYDDKIIEDSTGVDVFYWNETLDFGTEPQTVSKEFIDWVEWYFDKVV